MSDVTEGPESLVGEAVVVALFLLGREPHAPQPVVIQPRGHLQTAASSGGDAVGRARPVGDPRTGTGPHDRLDGRHQPAGRAFHDNAVGAMFMNVGLAIRHDQHLVAAELGAKQGPQVFGRPFGLRPLRTTNFVFKILETIPQFKRDGGDLGWRSHRREQALSTQQGLCATDPAIPADLRHGDRDDGNHQAKGGNESDQIASGVLTASLDETHVVQQHEMCDCLGRPGP